MYGTIARIQIHPDKIEQVQALSERIGLAPGQI